MTHFPAGFTQIVEALEKDILCKLQRTRCMLQSRFASCNAKNPCNRCRELNQALLCVIALRDKLLRVHVTRCNLAHNAIATQAAKKIALCNTSYRVWFCYLQRLQRFFKPLQTAARDYNGVFETIASYILRTCIVSFTTSNGFLFPALLDKL